MVVTLRSPGPRTEGRRGERDEEARVLGHCLGHALAADEPCLRELVGVSPIALRARRTDEARRFLHAT